MKLTPAGKSIFFFSFWVLGCGIGLLFFPGLLFPILDLPKKNLIIARIFGMVLLFLGYYYLRAGLVGNMKTFYRWTTHTRPLAFVIGLVFVILKLISPLLLFFVAIDIMGALWTWLALKKG